MIERIMIFLPCQPIVFFAANPTPYIAQMKTVPINFGSKYEKCSNARGSQNSPTEIAIVKNENPKTIDTIDIFSSVSRLGSLVYMTPKRLDFDMVVEHEIQKSVNRRNCNGGISEQGAGDVDAQQVAA